jgi:GDP-L-fucose synthase
MAEKIFDLAGKRVYVAGHTGMVGSAIVRRLASIPCETITADRATLDLERQAEVEAFLAAYRPEVVIVAAARVGGIHANNTYPAEFISVNLAIARNAIHASYQAGVRKLLFLGSSCIYPQLAHQPMREEELLTGPLEPTNQWYAVARSCSRDRSSRPINGMPSPRLPASSCARPIGGNTAAISSR